MNKDEIEDLFCFKKLQEYEEEDEEEGAEEAEEEREHEEVF